MLELFSVPWSSSFTWIFVFSSAKHTQFTRKNHCGVQNFSQLWLVAACKLHFVQFLFHILFSCSSFRVFYVLFISFSHIFFLGSSALVFLFLLISIADILEKTWPYLSHSVNALNVLYNFWRFFSLVRFLLILFHCTFTFYYMTSPTKILSKHAEWKSNEFWKIPRKCFKTTNKKLVIHFNIFFVSMVYIAKERKHFFLCILHLLVEPRLLTILMCCVYCTK